jgi:hypothetical protein
MHRDVKIYTIFEVTSEKPQLDLACLRESTAA